MKIELRRLVDIFPYKQNARKIPQRAIDKVASSLKEFGWPARMPNVAFARAGPDPRPPAARDAQFEAWRS